MDLVEARAKRRLTQWDIRMKTGIHQSKISLLERGYVIPSEKEKIAIAKALKIPMDELKWPKNGDQ